MNTSNLHILPFGPQAWERRREIFAGMIADRATCGKMPVGRPDVGPEAGLPDFRDILILVPNERKAKPLLALFLDALEKARVGRQSAEAGQSDAAQAAGLPARPVACIPPAVMALNRFVESRIRGVKIIHPAARKLLLEDICRGLKGSRSNGLDLPWLEDEELARSLSGPISEALERIYLNNAGVLPDDGNTLLPAPAYVKKEYEKRLRKLGLSDRAAVLAGWEPKAEDFAEYHVVILDGFYDALPHELRLMKAATGRPASTVLGRCGSSRFYFILEAQGLMLPELSAEGMPYAGTQRLINELFPGETASFCDQRSEQDARIFAGAIFLGRPISETVRLLREGTAGCRLKIISTLTPEDEVVFIARTIKERALEGRIRLDRTLILFPEPEAYAHALKEIFTDYGIPYNFGEEKPLISSPPAQAFLSLLSIPAEGYPFRLVRRAFYPPVGSASGAAADFELCVRDRSRATGAPSAGRSFWEALAREKRSFSGELSRILDWLGPLDKRDDYPAGWAELALGLLDNTGMKDSLEPLEKTLPELREALKNLNLKIAPGRFISMLKDAMNRGGARHTSEFRGVRALGRLEAFSEGFETVFIAGMNSDIMPPGTRQDLFFGTAPWTLEGRTRDSRLFMGLLLGAKEAYLSYPKEKGGRAASPSPWIMALRPFVIAGQAEEINDYSRPSEPEAAMGEGELQRAMAIGGCQPENEETPPEVCYPPQKRRRFSATELEAYIRCGYRYWHRYILRDMPPEEPGEDESSDMAGRVVHDILAKFYAGRKGRSVRPDEMETAHAELSRLAGREFARLPESLANREAKRKFLEKYVPRVLAADSELPVGVVIADVEKKVDAEIPVNDTETAVITGRIDRLELNENGSYALVDYKTGHYPNGKDIPLSKEFQLPLYAYLLRNCLPDRRPSSFVYYNLGRAGETRDVVCCDSTRYTGKATKNKKRKREDGAQMDEYVNGIAAKAASAALGIIEGRFPKADSEEECRYCELADACPGADEKEPEGSEQ